MRQLLSAGGMGEDFGPDAHTAGLGTLLDLLDTPDPPSACLVTDAVSTDHMALQVDSTGERPPHAMMFDLTLVNCT